MRKSDLLLLLCFITQLSFADAAFDETMSKAESGDAKAQLQVGNLYSTGDLASGVSKNHMRAIKWYTQAAEQNDAEAQTNLALIYYKGDTVIQNHKQAFDWFSKAADMGDAKAQEYLGEMHRLGKGVPKNFKNSYIWYAICCASGNGEINYKKEVSMHLTDAEIREANAEVIDLQKKIEQHKAARK